MPAKKAAQYLKERLERTALFRKGVFRNAVSLDPTGRKVTVTLPEGYSERMRPDSVATMLFHGGVNEALGVHPGADIEDVHVAPPVLWVQFKARPVGEQKAGTPK